MKKNETKNNATINKFYSNDVEIKAVYELAKKIDNKATLLVKQSTDEQYITLFGDNGVRARCQVWICSKKIDIYVGNNVVNQSLANVANIAVVDNVGKAKHSKNEIVLSYSNFDNVKAFFKSVIDDMSKQSEQNTEKTDKQSEKTAKQSSKRKTQTSKKRDKAV